METIKKLLTDGVVTIEEVLEYVEQYQRAVDKYDDEQINKYYQEQYYPEENYAYAQNQSFEYGDWECSEGTLHSHDQECDCPNYKEEIYSQEYIDEMNAQLNLEEEMYVHTHSANPTYIVASTLRYLEETLIFESDENGYIPYPDDYGGIAERWTPGVDWTDSDLAVTTVFGEGVFEKISDITPHEKGYYVIYKRINNIN